MAWALIAASVVYLVANYAGSKRLHRKPRPTTEAAKMGHRAAEAMGPFLWVLGVGLIVAGGVIAIFD
jgi:hypothetical protein